MHLIVHHGHAKHGSATYARDKSTVLSSHDFLEEGMEILRVETTKMVITSVYKPPSTPFSWPHITNPVNKPNIITGDFNGHNTIWGYDSNDSDGEAVESWAASNDLTILYSSKDKHTFSSARWKRGYNHDLAFVSSQHFSSFERTVGDPIPKSQHRPTALQTKPVFEETIQLGEDLTTLLANERSERWKELITSVDMTYNSKKAWATIKRLNSEKNVQTRVAAVTPNQVANQLLQNGKPANKEKGHKKRLKGEMEQAMRDSSDQFEKFTPDELNTAMILMKTGKAAGLDGITTEMIQPFGPKTMSLVLNLFNNCVRTCRIPNGWRKTKVVALLKPGKDPKVPKKLPSHLSTMHPLQAHQVIDGPLGKAAPLLVFGAAAVLAGILDLLLPETRRRQLPETVEEAENMKRYM
ncbi:RNA-directed DNA polymerase from mobile element jockey-like [Elysia marginata]|uniref:RNA-directed DNA polymerase from mobile element jockey-like n=1 Tax=Elysia marginata TaxID=1093978 RepID=A0AAV4EH99_9GAST|nr:RNA-directed DNA polymerase from mobile element jockey-like [Elysia marginata]